MIGLEELYPLWALSSRDAGGLEYSTVQIGKVRHVIEILILEMMMQYIVMQWGQSRGIPASLGVWVQNEGCLGR